MGGGGGGDSTKSVNVCLLANCVVLILHECSFVCIVCNTNSYCLQVNIVKMLESAPLKMRYLTGLVIIINVVQIKRS